MKKIQHTKANYSKITNSIYVGTSFCCQVHFDKGLLKKGIRVDISLQEAQVATPFGVECYLWLPVKDHYAPSSYQFAVGVLCIAESLKKKRKVYVHCRNGHGRAPTMVAAYFILTGLSAKEALKKIRNKRGIHLRKTQVAALEKFAKLFRAKNIDVKKYIRRMSC